MMEGRAMSDEYRWNGEKDEKIEKNDGSQDHEGQSSEHYQVNQENRTESKKPDAAPIKNTINRNIAIYLPASNFKSRLNLLFKGFCIFYTPYHSRSFAVTLFSFT